MKKPFGNRHSCAYLADTAGTVAVPVAMPGVPGPWSNRSPPVYQGADWPAGVRAGTNVDGSQPGRGGIPLGAHGGKPCLPASPASAANRKARRQQYEQHETHAWTRASPRWWRRGGGGGPVRHHAPGNIPLNRNHVFDSNGPDIRVRGTAQQLFEKYLQLGRDATSGGDRVMAESYFQHAEHYFRILNAMNQAVQQGQQGNGGQSQQGQRRPYGNEDDMPSGGAEVRAGSPGHGRPAGSSRDPDRRGAAGGLRPGRGLPRHGRVCDDVRLPHRHGRACPGHPFSTVPRWMAGTSPAMTETGGCRTRSWPARGRAIPLHPPVLQRGAQRIRRRATDQPLAQEHVDQHQVHIELEVVAVPHDVGSACDRP